ncbi:MAG: hypothetical protein Q7K98_00280 [Candidatus Omnitrophota bacterium]|nr:hypothetical protein [Candidatus Omnitrophota bacterium]
MAVLLIGLLSLWKWSSDNIVKRQLSYNASRAQEGSRSAGLSQGTAALPALTDKDKQSLLDTLQAESDSFPSLSLDQLTADLERTDKAIQDLQASLSTLVGFRDGWQKDFEDAQQAEADSQQKIDALKAQIASLEEQKLNPQTAGYDESGQLIYVDYDGQINALNQEIAKTQNGYYTIETTSWNESGPTTVATYDYSNTQWMSRFGTREEWAKDYSIYHQYGASEGSATGLYANYTPGLLDWQARKDYAQQQRDTFQSSVTSTASVLSGMQDMQSKLQKAKESKSQ